MKFMRCMGIRIRIPRIKKMKTLEDYRLLVVFDNDKVVEYDVKELPSEK